MNIMKMFRVQCFGTGVLNGWLWKILGQKLFQQKASFTLPKPPKK